MSYRQVLASPNVPQLLLAASLSRLAEGVLLFVVVLYVIVEFGSASLAGLSAFFLTLPGFLVSPVAGAVLDRLGVVRAVVLDTLSSAVLIATIAVLSWADALRAPILFVLLTLYSLTSPLTSGGIRTLFPRFVPEPAYDKANALDLSTFSVIDVVGPLIAGALFAGIGANPTLLCVAVTYALAAASVALLREPAPETEHPPPRQHLLRAAWDGVVHLVRNPTLRALAVSYSLYQAASGMLIVIVPVAVGRWLGDTDGTERYVGVLWAVAGLAGTVGALVAGRLVGAGRERAYMVGATLVCAAAIFPVSALGSIVALGAGLALVGLSEGAVNVSLLSLRQRRTEPAWLGRVMTVSISVNLMGFPVGTLLGGLVVTHSVTVALAVAAALAVGSAASARLLVPGEA
ncbi:Predicted arabinose efflux permease, MFS family [Micromonospora pallida]|uniref:Predicted arabinose efflux permease, MFS family n=1 Tax=Micromonospora pallida TaxID=145854 RepID=A0A1C6SA36_9ACTN|nr:Predicted arabinose efflux permease, MFS family [Micromonospora pallida]